MTPIVRAKVSLLIIGGLLLAYGIRADLATLRWVAIGVLAVAFLLRLANRRDAKAPSDEAG
ncbi:MAG: hypothetical protein U0163_17890 [Gemmatimonadaceae bacterium]